MASFTRSRIPNVTLENTRIMFRNFSGKEGQFNRAGDRNFAVPLDAEIATQMTEDGWNVKQLRPREEGESPQDYIQIKVKYSENAKPPRVVMVTGRGRTNLGESEIDMLDWVEIENVDLIFRPYEWEMNGKTGVSAYLQSIYVTIREDELDKKYADVPDSAQSARQYDQD